MGATAAGGVLAAVLGPGCGESVAGGRPLLAAAGAASFDFAVAVACRVLDVDPGVEGCVPPAADGSAALVAGSGEGPAVPADNAEAGACVDGVAATAALLGVGIVVVVVVVDVVVAVVFVIVVVVVVVVGVVDVVEVTATVVDAAQVVSSFVISLLDPAMNTSPGPHEVLLALQAVLLLLYWPSKQEVHAASSCVFSSLDPTLNASPAPQDVRFLAQVVALFL